ncbi:hypothetical protein BH23ACT6_BH23ACT6_03240 [soil metagenome]
MTQPESTTMLFHDLDTFIAEPRLAGLTVNADGSRLVTTLSTRSDKGTAYRSALWEIDPRGQQPARRLTRSVEGEKRPIFGVSGDLLFLSDRSTGSADAEGCDAAGTALWSLDAHGGEAHLVLERPGGISAAVCAASADVLLLSADVYPGVGDEDEQKQVHTRRQDAGVDAILHTGYPVRFWDHDLGPAQPELFALSPTRDVQLLTAGLQASLREHEPVISPQGTFVLTTATIAEAAAEQRNILLRIEVATGEQARLIDDADTDVLSVLISPDEHSAVVALSPKSSPHTAPDRRYGCLTSTPVSAPSWLPTGTVGAPRLHGPAAVAKCSCWPTTPGAGPSSPSPCKRASLERPSARCGRSLATTQHTPLSSRRAPDRQGWPSECAAPRPTRPRWSGLT